MLAYAKEARAELAILTDMGAACGSQVISDGCSRPGSPRFAGRITNEGAPVTCFATC